MLPDRTMKSPMFADEKKEFLKKPSEIFKPMNRLLGDDSARYFNSEIKMEKYNQNVKIT